MRAVKSQRGEKVIRSVQPNVGLEMAYRRKLDKLIEEMHQSVMYWVMASYRANAPEIAMDAAPARVTAVETQVGTNKRGRVWFCYVDGVMLRDVRGVGRTWRSLEAAEEAGLRSVKGDAVVTEDVKFGERFDRATINKLRIKDEGSPAANLQRAVNAMKDKWLERFDKGAEALAKHFAEDVLDRSDTQLKSILKKAGISVKWQMTEAQQDVLVATVQQNVSLIKSIPTQYLSQVEGMVQRSVQTGRDLGQLSKDLQKRLGVTKRRAALISRDQNNKATSAFQRVRQQELGVTEAIWMHSHAGKEPRKSHLANNGLPYNVQTGWYDPEVKEHIWPGQLINCRCTSRAVIPGFS